MTEHDYSAYPSDETFHYLTKEVPGYGRPVPPDSPVPPDLFDSERELVFRPTRGLPLPRGPVFQGNGPSFALSSFADELRTRLAGSAKGWAFAITTDGQLTEEGADADGEARTPEEGGLAMTTTRRLNIASVSKTITAVAVLRLLEENGLTVEDFIWPFLPDSWTLGAGVAGLRFRHLLRHETGLTSTNNNFSTTLSYDGLATAIANGAVPDSDRLYLNANFALFRVIIPALWAGAGHPAANNDNEAAAAFFYAVYIIEELFGRMEGAIGENASTSELDNNPTRYYNNAGSTTGISFGNWALIAGGGGWHLSAAELAAFLANITYNDDVLSPAARAQMDTMALGWRPLANTVGQFGQYYGHGGSIGGGGGRVRTGIVKFSIQVEAALIANSAIAGFSDPVALLMEAFDAAWT